MLISAQLKNFRRHEDLTVTFTEGLNVIRGANEGGKTTILEAVLYAFFGAAALRDTLAETVTWGAKETALWVNVVVRVRGTLYAFTRSKNGAECRGDDNTVVTGQKEVSAFAGELLGADAKTAPLLMMASQAGLRGALDEGASAVSGLMAKLANFDMVDKLLLAADNRLLLGSVTPFEQKINQAKVDREGLVASMPDDSGLDELRARVTQIKSDADKAQELADQLQDKVAEANEAIGRAEDQAQAYFNAERQMRQYESRIVEQCGRLESAKKTAQDRLNDEAMAELKRKADEEANFAARAKLYAQFKALPPYPESFWEGSYDDFFSTMRGMSQNHGVLKLSMDQLKRSVEDLQRQKITNGRCPTCGSVKNSDEHVAAHNAQIDSQIAAKQAELSAEAIKFNALTPDLLAMEVIDATHKGLQRLYEPLDRQMVITLDHNFVPAKASWVGDVPVQPDGSAGRDLSKALEKAAAATAAEAQALVYQQNIAQLRADFDAAVVALEKLPKPSSMDQLKVAYDEAYRAYRAQVDLVSEKRQQAVYIEATITGVVEGRQRVQRQIEELDRRLVEYEEQIKQINFNNALVAKLKKIKPAITDHLWSITLAAVSAFFSTMRSEHSVVTKDKDGFKVNGKSVDSLSGSTLDVLALAIRVGLTKTFIPHSTFIVLDEPAHGCDDARTGNVLGFLSSAGFTQTILASHDELSESVADNVIAVTA